MFEIKTQNGLRLNMLQFSCIALAFRSFFICDSPQGCVKIAFEKQGGLLFVAGETRFEILSAVFENLAKKIIHDLFKALRKCCRYILDCSDY